MKTMTVFEARNNFSRTLDAARKEDLLLERSNKFWTMIARARSGKAVSLTTVRRQLGRGRTTRRRRSADT